MRETADQFVHWLLGQYDDPTKRQDLSHTEIYGRLQNVELGVSLTASAISTHEVYISYREAGFNEAQAMKLILNAQAAAISAAAAQNAHREEKGDGDKG